MYAIQVARQAVKFLFFVLLFKTYCEPREVDGGDDVLKGGAGDDWIAGGDGNDMILAGDNNDTVWGETGSDTIFGEDGNDKIYGDSYSTTLSALDGNDFIGDAALLVLTTATALRIAS